MKISNPCRVIYRLLESGESIESICGYTELKQPLVN